jgi:hypothetical protein
VLEKPAVARHSSSGEPPEALCSGANIQIVRKISYTLLQSEGRGAVVFDRKPEGAVGAEYPCGPMRSYEAQVPAGRLSEASLHARRAKAAVRTSSVRIKSENQRFGHHQWQPRESSYAAACHSLLAVAESPAGSATDRVSQI